MKQAPHITAALLLDLGAAGLLALLLHLTPAILSLEDEQTGLLAAKSVPLAVLVFLLAWGVCHWRNRHGGRLCRPYVPHGWTKRLTIATVALLLSGFLCGATLFISGSTAYPVPTGWIPHRLGDTR